MISNACRVSRASVFTYVGLLIALSLSERAHAGPDVIVTIKPIHSLVSAVMQGVGEPELLLHGLESPHHYFLKPSEAQALERADLVVWVGPELESFMVRPIDVLVRDATVVTLVKIPSLERLRFRENPITHEEKAGEHTEHGDGHHHAEEHHHGEGEDVYDPHLWLDPFNAIVVVQEVARELSTLDPDHAAQYQKNAAAVMQKLEALDGTLKQILAPVHEQRFIVFHDAWQYLERRYGLSYAGAILTGFEHLPSAKRIETVRHQVEEGVVCAFAEPQFNPQALEAIVRDTGVRSAVLDPIGAHLEAGAAQYFLLMQEIADSMHECLKH